MATQVHIFQIRNTRTFGEEISSMMYSGQALNIDSTGYDRVYSMETEEDMSLEDVFEMFNINHPEDYRGRSLSVTDVVILNEDAYICAPFGWNKIEFDYTRCGERE